MPKLSKQTRKFKLPYVLKEMRKWQTAADQLKATAQESYKNIRRYIPRFEATLTSDERVELATQLSKFTQWIREVCAAAALCTLSARLKCERATAAIFFPRPSITRPRIPLCIEYTGVTQCFI